jgi:hypothetical protein
MPGTSIETDLRPISRRLLVGLALAGILLIGLGARFYLITQQSLFVDELWNLELASGRGSMHLRLPSETLLHDVPSPTSLTGAPSWLAIWSHMDLVTHPPLFSLLLRLWCDLFGAGDLSGRAFSVILSTLAVLVVFDAVRIHNESVVIALWAALIMSLAGAQIELAQEIRPYTLLLLLGMAALDAIMRIERYGPAGRRIVALGILSLLMLLTHYFSIAAIGALLLYCAWRLRGTARMRTVGAIVLAGILFAIMWGPFMLAQRASLGTGDDWLAVSEPNHPLRTLQRLAILPMLMLFNPQRNASPLIYASAVVLLIPLWFVSRRPKMLIWVLWFWATVAAMTVLELVRSTRHLEFLRYTLLAAPALYVMLADLVPGTSRLFVLLRSIVPPVVAVCCALSLPATYYPWKSDYRQVARFLDQRISAGEPVIFSTSGTSPDYGASFFMGVAHYARSYPWPIVIAERELPAATIDQLRAADAVWVVAPMNGRRAADLLAGAPGDPTSFLFVPGLGTCERVFPRKSTTRP